MKSRREFLTLGASALPALALTACASQTPANKLAAIANDGGTTHCRKAGAGASAKYFPSLVVMTHEGRKAWFYDDLIKGKIVGINFMSVQGESRLPVTANLAKVQDLLGNRLGEDVFMVSITTDPERDTPQALEAFARRHGARQGWVFVTGKPDEINALMHHLGSHGHGAGAGNHNTFRYGNESYARWASFHAMAKPEQLVQRFDWVTVRETLSTPKSELS